MKRGQIDITRSDHVTMVSDASIHPWRGGRGCVAVTISNIRHTFVFPSISEDANDAEFEGVVCALQLLMTFKNWYRLNQVKICSDNDKAIEWAKKRKHPIGAILKSCSKYAPQLIVKFQRLHKTHNVLQHHSARTWMKIMEGRWTEWLKTVERPRGMSIKGEV